MKFQQDTREDKPQEALYWGRLTQYLERVNPVSMYAGVFSCGILAESIYFKALTISAYQGPSLQPSVQWRHDSLGVHILEAFPQGSEVLPLKQENHQTHVRYLNIKHQTMIRTSKCTNIQPLTFKGHCRRFAATASPSPMSISHARLRPF